MYFLNISLTLRAFNTWYFVKYVFSKRMESHQWCNDPGILRDFGSFNIIFSPQGDPIGADRTAIFPLAADIYNLRFDFYTWLFIISEKKNQTQTYME